MVYTVDILDDWKVSEIDVEEEEEEASLTVAGQMLE